MAAFARNSCADGKTAVVFPDLPVYLPPGRCLAYLACHPEHKTKPLSVVCLAAIFPRAGQSSTAPAPI